jgi:N-acetylmuramoyl-L-alanine amidase
MSGVKPFTHSAVPRARNNRCMAQRSISLLVIHCSASPNGDSLFRASLGTSGARTPVQAIDGWHAARGFKRSAAACRRLNPGLPHIGYHFVIYTNGAVATGRGLDEIGAHVQGFNQKSVGICMVGTDRFSAAQWSALAILVGSLAGLYPEARVLGHRDLSPDQNANGIVEKFEWLKTCPGFDVTAWRAAGMTALPDHLLEAH